MRSRWRAQRPGSDIAEPSLTTDSIDATGLALAWFDGPPKQG